MRGRRRDRARAAAGTGLRGRYFWLSASLVFALLTSASIAGLVIAQNQAERHHTIAQRFGSRHTTASRFMHAYISQAAAHEIRLAKAEFTGKISQTRFDEITQETQYSTAILLDAGGHLLAISPADPSLIGKRVDTTVAALVSAEMGKATATDVVSPGSGRTPVVGVAVPFDTPTGRRVFAGGYTITSTPLQPFVVSALSTYKTAHVYLIDSAGVVIAADRTRILGLPLHQAAPPLAAAISRHATGYLGSRGHRQYYVAGPIEGTRWKLVFVLDTKELFVTLTPIQKWAPWTALIAFVLLSLGMISLFTRALAGRARAEEDHARQESILDTAGDAFIGMDAAGLVTDWNTAAGRLLGWTRAEAIGQSVAGLMVPARDRARYTAALGKFLEVGSAQLPQHPLGLTAQHRDGHQIPVELTVSRTQWQGSWRFHAFMRDISERLEHEHQLQELALTDSLTGLANRRAFQVNLEQAHARASRHNSELAVVYADIDEFKSINDTYGHAAGDAILVQVADRLRAHFRTEDTIGRLGGDEFAVVCEDFTASTHTLADRLRDVLAIPYMFRGQPVLATVSVGMASREDNETVEHLLDRADATMYEVKAAQRSFRR